MGSPAHSSSFTPTCLFPVQGDLTSANVEAAWKLANPVPVAECSGCNGIGVTSPSISLAKDPAFVPKTAPGLPIPLPVGSAAVSTASDISLEGATLSGLGVIGNSAAGGGSLLAQAFLLPGSSDTVGSSTAVRILAAVDSNSHLQMVKVQVTVTNGKVSTIVLASGYTSPAPQVLHILTLHCDS